MKTIPTDGRQAAPRKPWRLTAFTVLLAVLLAATNLRAQTAPGITNQLLEATQRKANALLARPELSAYRGWIKFLRFQAEREIARASVTNDLSRTNVARFADWVRRIEAKPGVLVTLRGVQEWAYESPADDSGQPFKLNIPTDYNPARPPGLVVILHYATGDHLASWMQPHRGMFELAVLGRARVGGYVGLAEADVLHAMDYVESHWRIDTNRIQLTGTSMGGVGVATLAADYPHLFASGQINCGLLLQRPVNNLLTFPVYAIHSEDDWLAPIITSRGPLARLRELGGQVIFDETNGFGHDVWRYNTGNQRAEAWRQRQVRPDSRTVRRLDFTALSGAAARAWWAEVLEWGPAPRPAHFALTAGADNTLYAELSNITRLRLRIGESPFDRKQPLRVSVGGAVPFEISAPLPESLVLVSGPQGWQAEKNTELPSFRLHTPGGSMLLYDGSPLLIVYGTGGDTNVCEAMRSAAEAASKSPNPAWAYDVGPAGSDGVPHRQNLYGRLKVKADRDVTETDLQKCHLVLIGTAEQNSVVARLAPQLPVRWIGGKISCSDGLDLDGTNRVISLVHYNPLAPQRLISWVASEVTNGYAGHTNFAFQTGADLVVTDLGQQALVVARSFDSRWRWDPARAASPLLPTNLISERDLDVAFARALRQGTGADFGFNVIHTNTSPLAISGTTRLADGLAFYYYQPMCLVDLTGTELLEAERRRKAEAKEESPTPLYPAFDPAKIEPGRKYRVAVCLGGVYSLGKTFKLTTQSFRMTDLETADILDRFLLSNEYETDPKN